MTGMLSSSLCLSCSNKNEVQYLGALSLTDYVNGSLRVDSTVRNLENRVCSLNLEFIIG